MANRFEYIKSYYGVPAEKGREIIFQKKDKGVIVKARSANIGVNFNNSKPGQICWLHPTWEVEYLDTFGEIRKKRSKE